jgi:hypothetical protein
MSKLDQDVDWVTRDGRIVLLAEMGEGHRANLLRWLERRARHLLLSEEIRGAWLMEGAHLVPMWHSDGSGRVVIDVDMPDGVFSSWAHLRTDIDDITQDEALRWLQAKPLYRKLRELTGNG